MYFPSRIWQNINDSPLSFASPLLFIINHVLLFFALWAFRSWENYNVRHDEVTVAAARFQFCAGEAA